MATTSPDNISYPTNASTKKTFEAHIQDTATSVQTAFTSTRNTINTIPISQNILINSGMDFWQRGTSGFTSGYCADRWVVAAGNMTVSRSADVPNAMFKYSLEASNSVANYLIIDQRIESANSAMLDLTVTLSVYAKSLSGTQDLSYEIYSANSVDNFSALSVVAGGSLSSGALSTSWTRYSKSITINDTCRTNGMVVRIFRTNTSTSSMRITGTQLESGSNATPFRRGAGTVDQEFSACKRYFWALTPATLPGQIASLHATGSTGGYAGFIFGHTFRAAPSMTVSSANVLRWHNPGISIGEATSLSASTGVDSMQITMGASGGLGYGSFYAVEWTTSSGYIWLSAEL